MKNNIEIVLSTKIRLSVPPEHGVIDLDGLRNAGVMAICAAMGVSARKLGFDYLLEEAARGEEERCRLKAREEMLDDINN